MPFYYHKPENALNRAQEFIELGRKDEAIDALYAVIKSRKHRTWLKIHETIMEMYLLLCVELQKSHSAKEGLYHYRNMCQSVNIKSLEDIIRTYLQFAEKKADDAREKSQVATVDVDDLDQFQTPESLLLSAVSCEDSQDRTERVVLMPWLKFLWESYRICLELLRSNAPLERLYHEIAQDAFRFCLSYNRKAELRKLCNNLRVHLGHIHKRQNHLQAFSPLNAESQTMHLETGIIHLESAVQLELWQEAFRAIEDIHGIISLSKKITNPRLMANYYEKLSLVFWKANDYLFHAAALFRFFLLSREQKKNITQEELSSIASRVVLATLSIPIPPSRLEMELLVETDETVLYRNQMKLSTLLGLPRRPSRELLVKDLTSLNVVQYAPRQIQNLHQSLEFEFSPLTLGSLVSQAFTFISNFKELKECTQYIPRIREITVLKLLYQLSKVYQSIKFSKFISLVPAIDPLDLERLVAELARRHEFMLRIDHRNQSLIFQSDMKILHLQEDCRGLQTADFSEERNGKQLQVIYSFLIECFNTFHGSEIKQTEQANKERIVKLYIVMRSLDRSRACARRNRIEERKEKLENMRLRKEEEEKQLQLDKLMKLKEAEKIRLKRESEERSAQRLLREQTEMKKKILREKADLLRQTQIGARIVESLSEEDLARLDPEVLISKQAERISKEKTEFLSRLRRQERAADHFERAKRIEEIPLLLSEYNIRKEIDKEEWMRFEEKKVEQMKIKRSLDLQLREKVLSIKQDLNAFVSNVTKIKKEAYHEQLAKFEQMLNEERAKRLKDRANERKKARRELWIKEQKEKQQEILQKKLLLERERFRGEKTYSSILSRGNLMERRPLERSLNSRYNTSDVGYGDFASRKSSMVDDSTLNLRPEYHVGKPYIERKDKDVGFKPISILQREKGQEVFKRNDSPRSSYNRENERGTESKSQSLNVYDKQDQVKVEKRECEMITVDGSKDSNLESKDSWRKQSERISYKTNSFNRESSPYQTKYDERIEDLKVSGDLVRMQMSKKDVESKHHVNKSDSYFRKSVNADIRSSKVPIYWDKEKETVSSRSPRHSEASKDLEWRQKNDKPTNVYWRYGDRMSSSEKYTSDGSYIPWKTQGTEATSRREMEQNWRQGNCHSDSFFSTSFRQRDTSRHRERSRQRDLEAPMGRAKEPTERVCFEKPQWRQNNADRRTFEVGGNRQKEISEEFYPETPSWYYQDPSEQIYPDSRSLRSKGTMEHRFPDGYSWRQKTEQRYLDEQSRRREEYNEQRYSDGQRYRQKEYTEQRYPDSKLGRQEGLTHQSYPDEQLCHQKEYNEQRYPDKQLNWEKKSTEPRYYDETSCHQKVYSGEKYCDSKLSHPVEPAEQRYSGGQMCPKKKLAEQRYPDEQSWRLKESTVQKYHDSELGRQEVLTEQRYRDGQLCREKECIEQRYIVEQSWRQKDSTDLEYSDEKRWVRKKIIQQKYIDEQLLLQIESTAQPYTDVPALYQKDGAEENCSEAIVENPFHIAEIVVKPEDDIKFESFYFDKESASSAISKLVTNGSIFDEKVGSPKYSSEEQKLPRNSSGGDELFFSDSSV